MSGFATNQNEGLVYDMGPSQVVQTDGNHSMSGHSQSKATHQSNAEAREYQMYRRNVFSNMTYRVLQQKQQINEQMRVQSEFKKNMSANKFVVQPFIEGSNQGKLGPNDQPGESVRMSNISSQRDLLQESLNNAGDRIDGPKSLQSSIHGGQVTKPQQQLTQNNQMSKTFSKVPPKRYKASSTRNDMNSRPKIQQSKPFQKGTKGPAEGQNDNQLLYKIKYINAT